MIYVEAACALGVYPKSVATRIYRRIEFGAGARQPRHAPTKDMQKPG
ncbi:hypothetical protein [Belnapia rosea]|nr:hypothetical protein [Belnapia rosea]